MQYTDLKLTVNVADLDTACAVATMASPNGFSLEDYSDLLVGAPAVGRVDYYDEGLLAQDTTRAVLHLYLADGDDVEAARLYIDERFSGLFHTIELTRVSDEGWAENWKKYFKPFTVGERLAVCPSWESFETDGARRVIRLDPGMAFGSGTHETTRLCLEALEGCINGGERVLDMGCGSGILSIAASLLGAREVVACDIDPIACTVARDNAAANGCDVRVVCGDAISDSDTAKKLADGYDVVAANIVADVIIAFADFFALVIKNGGALVASGIIDTRADEVEHALEHSGFSIERRLGEGGWRAVCARRSK